MNFRLACLTASVFAFTCPPWSDAPCQAADDELDVTETYSQIVADYQQIAANGNDAAQAAASRLIGHAYRRLIDQAKGLKLEADDLYALAGCHEGLGELDKAKQLYARSLAAKADPRTHLALVRLNLGDLQAAEKHFAAAIKLDPQYPGLIQFHLGLANAHQRKRNWQDAARHLLRYVHYAKSLSDVRPGDRAAQAAHAAAAAQLKSMQRFAAMSGKPAPPLKAEHWIQGGATELDKLAGKVLLVDFCALWAAPSRVRMEQMKKLQGEFADKGLEVIGVTLAYGHRFDPETDLVTLNADRSPADERADVAAYAKKHGIGYRLGVIPRATTDEYGVGSLPHTVLIDRRGNVKMVLQAGDNEQDAELQKAILELLLFK